MKELSSVWTAKANQVNRLRYAECREVNKLI